MARLRNFSLSLLVLTLSFVLALALGEGVVRLVAPQQLIVQRPELYRALDSLGYAHQPNIRIIVNTGDRDALVVTDAEGFRMSSQGRDSAQHHVLLLGDSFMAALQMEYEQSLAGLMEHCWPSTAGSTLSVHNAGVSGWDAPQYLIQARRALSERQYDAVVVSVFLGNDIVSERYVHKAHQADALRRFRWPRSLAWSEWIDAMLAPLNDRLKQRSHLFLFFKNRTSTLLMKLGLSAVEFPSQLKRSEASSPRWDVTGGILEEIQAAAAAKGIPTIFLLIPAIEQVIPEVLQTRTESFRVASDSLDTDQPERLMMAQLSARRLPFVSLLEQLRAAYGRGVDLYGRVDVHPSPAGHRAMWVGVAPLLASTLKTPYTPAPASDGVCSAP